MSANYHELLAERSDDECLIRDARSVTEGEHIVSIPDIYLTTRMFPIFSSPLEEVGRSAHTPFTTASSVLAGRCPIRLPAAR